MYQILYSKTPTQKHRLCNFGFDFYCLEAVSLKKKVRLYRVNWKAHLLWWPRKHSSLGFSP